MLFTNTHYFSSSPKTDCLSCQLPHRENSTISPSTHETKIISLNPSIRETTYKKESKGTYTYLEELENYSHKPRKNFTRHLSLRYKHRDVYVSDGKSKLLMKLNRTNQEKHHTLQIVDSKAPKLSCNESIKLDKQTQNLKTSLKFSVNNSTLENQNSLANFDMIDAENHLDSEEFNNLDINPQEKKIYDWLDDEKVFIVAVDQKAAYNERLHLKSLNNIKLNSPERKITGKMSPMLKRRVDKGGITNPIIKSLKLMDFTSFNSSDNLARLLNAEMEI